MAEPGPLCVYEKRDPHIAIIRLNRPEKKNAISRDLYWALDECWQKAKSDDDVWSIILTGTADAFCVGGDLKENLAFAKGEMKGPRSGPRPADLVRGASRAESGPGRVEDPAALDRLLALPSVHLLVDGYNVSKTGYGELTLSDQRDRLCAHAERHTIEDL